MSASVFASSPSSSAGTNKNSAATQSQSSDQCATCHGHGTTTCTWCNGTGKMSAAGMSYTCSSCSGTGKMSCLGCGRTGKKREFKNETPATAPVGMTIDPAATTTFDPSISSSLAGTGVVCPICNGTGQKVCQSCSGNGFSETIKSSADYGYGSIPYWTKKSRAACHSSGKVPRTYRGGDEVR